MPKRRFQALVLTFFLAACIGVPLEAEPVVVIESPILESDMAGLQEILDQSIADFAAEIDELTGETLEKPDFLRGIILRHLPGHSFVPEHTRRNPTLHRDRKLGRLLQPLALDRGRFRT